MCEPLPQIEIVWASRSCSSSSDYCVSSEAIDMRACGKSLLAQLSFIRPAAGLLHQLSLFAVLLDMNQQHASKTQRQLVLVQSRDYKISVCLCGCCLQDLHNLPDTEWRPAQHQDYIIVHGIFCYYCIVRQICKLILLLFPLILLWIYVCCH